MKEKALRQRLGCKPIDIGWKDVKNKLGKNEIAIEFACVPQEPKIRKRTFDDLCYIALIVGNDSGKPKLVKICSTGEMEKMYRQRKRRGQTNCGLRMAET